MVCGILGVQYGAVNEVRKMRTTGSKIFNQTNSVYIAHPIQQNSCYANESFAILHCSPISYLGRYLRTDFVVVRPHKR